MPSRNAAHSGRTRDGRVRAREVDAMSDLREEPLRLEERQQAEPVGADSDRVRSEREVVGLAEGRDRGRGAGDVRAVGDFRMRDRGDRVADQREPVRADRDRRVGLAPDAAGFEDGRRRGSAGDVRAVGDLELAPAVVSDHWEPVDADRDAARRRPRNRRPCARNRGRSRPTPAVAAAGPWTLAGPECLAGLSPCRPPDALGTLGPGGSSEPSRPARAAGNPRGPPRAAGVLLGGERLRSRA